MEYTEDTLGVRSLASVVRGAMHARSMTIEKLARETGISERFLEAIVREHGGKLPAAPYVRGYLARIAEALRLDAGELWELYAAEHGRVVMPSQPIVEAKNAGEIRSWREWLTNTRVLIAIGIILGIVLVIWFRGSAFIGRPTLSLEHFDDTMSVTTSTLVVKGAIDPKNQLTINDEVVFPDDAGAFEKTLTLSPGFNTFHFKVRGILGKELDITKQVYLSTSTKRGAKSEKQVETTTTTTSN